FGVVARRGAAAGFGSDPVPQALVITGMVVAFAATAMALALLLRLFAASGTTALDTHGTNAANAPTGGRRPIPATEATRWARHGSCCRLSSESPAWCWPSWSADVTSNGLRSRPC